MVWSGPRGPGFGTRLGQGLVSQGLSGLLEVAIKGLLGGMVKDKFAGQRMDKLDELERQGEERRRLTGLQDVDIQREQKATDLAERRGYQERQAFTKDISGRLFAAGLPGAATGVSGQGIAWTPKGGVPGAGVEATLPALAERVGTFAEGLTPEQKKAMGRKTTPGLSFGERTALKSQEYGLKNWVKTEDLKREVQTMGLAAHIKAELDTLIKKREALLDPMVSLGITENPYNSPIGDDLKKIDSKILQLMSSPGRATRPGGPARAGKKPKKVSTKAGMPTADEITDQYYSKTEAAGVQPTPAGLKSYFGKVMKVK